MLPPWEHGPERIEQLLTTRNEAREWLSFYRSLLVFQKNLFELLDEVNGPAARDMFTLVDCFGTFLTWVAENGSTLLRSQAHEMRHWGRERQESLLLAYWRNEKSAAANFFPKAFLQPYAAQLVQRQITIADRQSSNSGCSACGAPPQLSYLQSPSSNATSEGAGRYLLCSLCFSQWPINRICCFHCNECDPNKLPCYQSESLPAVRIEACDTCKRYIKGIDLRKDIRAVPLIEEIATPALDLWARENGYTKVELNLAGI